MCGICGTFGLVDDRAVRLMNQSIAHRGPDDEGIYIDVTGRVALGHRRLSIIDLSPAGHQPMSYTGGRYWITFNGEIYNFAEIRVELERCGHRFHSATDTEVLLAAYAEWGEACLERLRGMFVFAIYDRGLNASSDSTTQSEQAHLFLARDRFGIKPLYYAQVDGIFLFASELKALLASGLISRRVDYQALWDYLSFGSVPQPRTLLADVKALLPGHAMTVSGQRGVKVRRYWDIVTDTARSFPRTRLMGQTEASRALRCLLEEATRLHMIADVPVGAFLSGGVDSTAVVGLMSRFVSRPIKTYSIGFETKYRRYSELAWAKIAAQRFNTEHTEVVVTGEMVRDAYDNLVYAIDQPSLDGTNTFFISQATRGGVTVALSGLGGDELLAGYPQFRRFIWAEKVAPRGLPQLDFQWLKRIIPRRFRTMAEFLWASPVKRHASIRCLMSENEKQEVVSHSFRSSFVPRSICEWYALCLRHDLDVVARVSYIELTGYMPNTLLRDVDAMSMAHALEVRPVLLDHKLSEYIFSLPGDLKIDGKDTKKVFTNALRDILPEEIIHRPKMGFEFPLAEWLADHLRDRGIHALETKEAKQIFNTNFLSQTKTMFVDRRPPQTRLWAYIMLIEWMRLHRCEVEAA